mmetsp:Transcript_4899/g.5955  ORF Transcript_4899/g.5955 Transcript_4899/m.5955 type:complete len:80 (+) Transcript_4899:44-283(+)
MRYMHAANLTGLPACVFPVSYTENNLPIAMQCIAGPWKEVCLQLQMDWIVTEHHLVGSITQSGCFISFFGKTTKATSLL